LEDREGVAYLKNSDSPYTGKSFEFHDNGQKKSEDNFKDGKPHGIVFSWYENGQKQAEVNFKDGKQHGDARGWHENGQKKLEGNYKDGKYDGPAVFWHENGQKDGEVNFKDGKPDGLTVSWHENGQKRTEINYKDGTLISSKFWNSKGEEVDSIEEAETSEDAEKKITVEKPVIDINDTVSAKDQERLITLNIDGVEVTAKRIIRDFPQFEYFYIASTGAFSLDELRIGKTYESVTGDPSANDPNIIFSDGFDYLEGEKLVYQKGWRTDGLSPSGSKSADCYTIHKGSLISDKVKSAGNRLSSDATNTMSTIQIEIPDKISFENEDSVYLSFLMRPEGAIGVGSYGGYFLVGAKPLDGKGILFGKPGSNSAPDDEKYAIDRQGGPHIVASGVEAEVNKTSFIVVKMESNASGKKVSEVKPHAIRFNNLEKIKGIRYLNNSDTPYTGKYFDVYRNGQKKGTGSYKDGKLEGLQTAWHENRQKKMEGDFKSGSLISSRYWNSEGKEVDSFNGAESKIIKTDPNHPNLNYFIKDDAITITNYNKKEAKTAIIPAVIGGKAVTSIGEKAFLKCTNLTSIKIPKSVTSIGDQAFYTCHSLANVTIPDGVTSIGKNAFGSCTSLTSITIPDGVTSIGEGAFRNCTSLTSITIGNGVTSIGLKAFYNCNGLTGITIPDGVTSIGNEAFAYCSSLTSITIPDGVTSIGVKAFADCNGLTSITIPDSVTSIAESAFADCLRLTEVKVEAGNLKFMDIDGVLYDSKQKLLISYPAGKAGTKYAITNSVTSIAENAFAGCRNLTSITISDSIPYIKDNAFRGSSSLTSITIPDGVTSIGNSAFRDCTKLTSIKIPESVTSIGDDAFYGCKSLTSIIIPDSVTRLWGECFYRCSSLTSITIGSGVASIKKGTFLGCTSLTNVTIPDTVTSIESSAFWNCNSLTSLTIGNGVTRIGKLAFYYCPNLDTVTFLGDAPKIAERAFMPALRTIYREADAKGWGDTLAGRPVKLITEKP
jgi:antitoxin component YwqK of YwqJK toxin-antitoxin module